MMLRFSSKKLTEHYREICWLESLLLPPTRFLIQGDVAPTLLCRLVDESHQNHLLIFLLMGLGNFSLLFL
jgi:hypothetical protein